MLARLGANAKRYERERQYRHKGVERPYTEVCWFFTGEWAQRVRADLPAKHPDWSLLWRMSQSEKVALYDAAMAGDGSGNAFEQKDRRDLEWFCTLLHLIGKRGRVTMRKNRNQGSVAIAQLGRTEMQSRHFAAAPDEHYEGLVWCVTVPTGAFLARRNGKVFVTGNSGFPKSLDVSKAIDKAAGAEREILGHVIYRDNPSAHATHSINLCPTDDGKCSREWDVSAPATPEAEQWEGWGTALKPAHEPIVVARKPLIGTVAQNVLEHGTGAINIDGCRVGADTSRGDRYNGKPPGGTGTSTVAFAGAQPEEWTVKPGRWPANVILSHHPTCREVGTKTVINATGIRT